MKLLALLFALSQIGWGQDRLQDFVVTVPVSTIEPIHVRAKDRLWADQFALRQTVWTKQEWEECEKKGCNSLEMQCGKTVEFHGQAKLIRDIFPEECPHQLSDICTGDCMTGVAKAAPKPSEPDGMGHACGAISCEDLAAGLMKHCHIERYDPGYNHERDDVPRFDWPPQERGPSWVKDESLRIVCEPPKEHKVKP